ncbi:hypothetical protein GCM10028777_12610 [Angustibacter speluncae]
MGLLPTPAELLGAAAGVKQVVTGTVDQVAESASGALALVPAATALLARASALLDRADALADHAQLVISRIDEVVTESDATVERVNVVTTKADRTMGGATGLVDRADSLLSSVEPVARQGVPIAEKIVDSISPAEVDAIVSIIDTVPTLLRHVQDDVLPLLQQLDAVGPDVHAILETVQDLAERIEALPGMGLLRRRADKDDD